MVKNQNLSSKKLGGYQKRGYSSSNTRQAQPLKKTFLKEIFGRVKARNTK